MDQVVPIEAQSGADALRTVGVTCSIHCAASHCAVSLSSR
jgi:hypothetical protein